MSTHTPTSVRKSAIGLAEIWAAEVAVGTGLSERRVSSIAPATISAPGAGGGAARRPRVKVGEVTFTTVVRPGSSVADGSGGAAVTRGRVALTARAAAGTATARDSAGAATTGTDVVTVGPLACPVWGRGAADRDVRTGPAFRVGRAAPVEVAARWGPGLALARAVSWSPLSAVAVPNAWGPARESPSTAAAAHTRAELALMVGTITMLRPTCRAFRRHQGMGEPGGLNASATSRAARRPDSMAPSK